MGGRRTSWYDVDKNVRWERLQHANADQINAISELVMNTLRGNVTIPPPLLEAPCPHKHALRKMARRRHSIKRRRHVMMAQTRAGVWNALDHVSALPERMNHGPFQKKYLVSPADMDRLVEHYKGTLTENSRLMHAARLAAKQHVLLTADLHSATKKIRLKALG